jgi:hypothetical protein
MPVRKFRSVEEMDGPIWHAPGDAALSRAIRFVWGLAHRTTKPHFPPGVYKHRTIEDLNALRQAWDDANFHAHRKRLESQGGATVAEGRDRGARG